MLFSNLLLNELTTYWAT